MKELERIHDQIATLSEQRSELWSRLSAGRDPEAAAQIKELDARLDDLWNEHRQLKASLRFGPRDEIVRRARAEERLERAA